MGEHQLEDIKNRITLLYTLFLLFVTTNESNKLNKIISVISLELILYFLLRLSSDMETNAFT